MLAEVLLGIEGRLEGNRFSLLERRVVRARARLLLPVRDRLFVAHDFDLVLLDSGKIRLNEVYVHQLPA